MGDADPLVKRLAARTRLVDAAGTSRHEPRSKDEGTGRVAGARLGYLHSMTLESSLGARHLGAGDQHLSLVDLESVGSALCLALLDLAREHAQQREEALMSSGTNGCASGAELTPVLPRERARRTQSSPRKRGSR